MPSSCVSDICTEDSNFQEFLRQSNSSHSAMYLRIFLKAVPPCFSEIFLPWISKLPKHGYRNIGISSCSTFVSSIHGNLVLWCWKNIAHYGQNIQQIRNNSFVLKLKIHYIYCVVKTIKVGSFLILFLSSLIA